MRNTVYQLSWYIPDQMLHLVLEGPLPREEMERINFDVLAVLDARKQETSILIDATKLQAEYNTVEYLRNTQKYLKHPQLGATFVVAGNKLNRLVTVMAFYSPPTLFKQFESTEKAKGYFEWRGLLN